MVCLHDQAWRGGGGGAGGRNFQKNSTFTGIKSPSKDGVRRSIVRSDALLSYVQQGAVLPLTSHAAFCALESEWGKRRNSAAITCRRSHRATDTLLLWRRGSHGPSWEPDGGRNEEKDGQSGATHISPRTPRSILRLCNEWRLAEVPDKLLQLELKVVCCRGRKTFRSDTSIYRLLCQSI